MQEGIQPMWEDDRNRQGGRWLVNTQKNFRQQELDRLWVETVRSFLIFRNWTYFQSFCFESYKLELILIIKSNELFSLVLLHCFLREVVNMFSLFLLSYVETLVKVLENLKRLWKHSPAARVPTAFLVLPNSHLCFCNLIETR